MIPAKNPVLPMSMAWKRRILYVVTLSVLIATAAVSAQEPFRVVFIAYENPNQLLEDVDPVVEYLEKQLDRPIRAFVATDYAGVVEALKNGSADMGFMGPLQYVVAHREANAKVILGEVYSGRPWYRSRLFVRRDSGLEKPADLRGKTIAFVDPISSSGSLYPLPLFLEAELFVDRDAADRFFDRTYFAGGDEQALRAVFNGFVDAAGIGEVSYDLLRPDERDQIVYIGESPKIPSHCVVVRSDLDPALGTQVKNSLLSLPDGDDKELLKVLYGVDGYVEVDHETYSSVEKLAELNGFLNAP